MTEGQPLPRTRLVTVIGQQVDGVTSWVGKNAASLFVYHASLVAAFGMAPIAEANLVNYLWPLLIVVLAAYGPVGMGLLPRQFAGCVIAFAGCAVVIAPSGAAPSSAHLAGYVLALVAALCRAV